MRLAEEVYALVRKIPRGRVTTYKIIAKQVRSFPRTIGQILKRNPYRNVPCHRVVMSNGFVGGFRGRKSSKKIELLEREGIKFEKSNSIKGKKIKNFEKILIQLNS